MKVSRDKKPTIQTIAEQAGVSISTVSQVLRNSGRISEDTRKKVRQAARKANYVQDRRAATLRSGRSRDLGLLIHKISNPFNAEVVTGMNSYLEEHGFLVYVLDAQDDLMRQKQYLRTILAASPGGLVWVPAVKTEQETIDWVQNHSKVTVTLLRPLAGYPFDHVGFDSSYGTSLATRHLIELGHRRIVYLGNMHSSDIQVQRTSGYLSALIEAGINWSQIRTCDENKTHAMAETMAIIEELPETTALVCNCDVVAAGAMLGLIRLGITPGKEVSVVGFDDIEDSRLLSPPLTTISVDPKGVGQQLAEVFLNRYANPVSSVRTSLLPVRLEIRQSTGPVRQ